MNLLLFLHRDLFTAYSCFEHEHTKLQQCYVSIMEQYVKEWYISRLYNATTLTSGLHV